jgi:hypothetical protein
VRPAMSSLPRLPAVVTRPVSAVLGTTATLLTLPGRALGLIIAAEQALAAANAALARAEAQLERTGEIIDRMDGVVQATSHAVATAAVTIEQLHALTASAAALLESYAGPVRRPGPVAPRTAGPAAPEETGARVPLTDRLPRLSDALDGGLIPLLDRLEQLGPHPNQLLDDGGNRNHRTNRLPGPRSVDNP